MVDHHRFLSFTSSSQLSILDRSLLTTSIQHSGILPGFLFLPCGRHFSTCHTFHTHTQTHAHTHAVAVTPRCCVPFTGTGDVLRVQALLHTCSEHFEDKEAKGAEDPPPGGGDDKDKKEQPAKPEPGSIAEVGSHQAFAVLGLALIAMGEGIGSEMALRTFNHLVRQCTHWLLCSARRTGSAGSTLLLTPAAVWRACDSPVSPPGS